MGLSQEYRKKIKESMDMNEGGRLRAIAEKAAVIDAPVLIIGLGGSGMDSLLATKKMIYDIIEREKRDDGKLADKPKNIEYLGIDTDQGYLNKSYHGIRLNKNAGEVKIYTMPNVQPVLAHPNLMPEYINKWLDCSLENDSVINGAGAVRQLGRLLLMQNISDVIHVLEEKIRKVTIGYSAQVPMYVFIIAGISGGTGSGTFIDIPYLVKAVSETMSSRPVQNIGLLFMPDVNANKDGVSQAVKSSLYANGFASLKELDYLMNIEHVGDIYEQKYGNLIVGSKSGRPVKPYDICLLLSSKDRNGALVAKGNECYELVTHVVAETIFNFVLGDSGVKNFNDFSINSWLANEVKNMSTYRTNLGDNRHPVSYVYSIAGASSANLPMDDIMSYLAYKMYQEVQNFWDQRPVAQHIDSVEKYFHLAKNMMVAEARNSLRQVNTSTIDAKVAINNHPQVVQLYEATLKKQKEAVVKNLERMFVNLQESLDDPNNIVNQYFKNLEKGPVFAQQCLFTNAVGQRSVITDLRQYKLDFASAIPVVEQISSLEQQVALALDDLRHAFLGKNGKLQIYLEKMNLLYKAKLDIFLYAQLQIFCGNADSILTDKNNEIFDIVSDLLRQMMPIFENYGAIKTSATTTRHTTGTTLSWTMVSTPDFIKQLEERMNQRPEFSVNLRTVVQDFYSYLFNNIGVWKDENQDAVENINSFIYKEFNVILDNSMDFFLEIIAQSEGKTLDEYCEALVSELTRRAEVRYPIESSFASGAVTQPGYSFISIPNNSPKLLAAAKKAALASTSAGGANSIVKASGVRDRIFMMNFMSATPLSLNADIKAFYSVYTQHRDSQKGLHLYIPTKVGKQVSDIDWRLLPSPYPESEWVGFTDSKDEIINDEYRNVLKKAISYGYVIEDEINRTLTLHFGNEIGLESISQECSIDLKSESTIKKMNARAFTGKVTSMLEKEAIANRCEKHLVRSDMVLDTDGTLKKSYEEMIFIQMYKPRMDIQRMVKNHEAALEAIQNVKNRVVDDSVVESFVKCRLTGEVNKHPKKIGTYVYFDREGTVHELIVLDGKQAQYPEYYLLKAFMELPDQMRKLLDMKSTNALNAGDDREKDITRLNAYKNSVILNKIESLNWDYEEIEDGEKILDAYKNLKVVITRLEQQLVPSNDFF